MQGQRAWEVKDSLTEGEEGFKSLELSGEEGSICNQVPDGSAHPATLGRKHEGWGVVSPALAESEGQRLMKEAPGLEGGGVG